MDAVDVMDVVVGIGDVVAAGDVVVVELMF